MQKRQESATTTPKKHNYLGPCADIFASSNTGSWRLERPRVDYARCVKCGTCAMYCPTNVITIEKEKEECVTFMWQYCKGCGICANECPRQCIDMVEERSVK